MSRKWKGAPQVAVLVLGSAVIAGSMLVAPGVVYLIHLTWKRVVRRQIPRQAYFDQVVDLEAFFVACFGYLLALYPLGTTIPLGVVTVILALGSMGISLSVLLLWNRVRTRFQ